MMRQEETGLFSVRLHVVGGGASPRLRLRRSRSRGKRILGVLQPKEEAMWRWRLTKGPWMDQT